MQDNNWRIGDKVLFIPNGKECTIDGFASCPNCGKQGITVEEIPGYSNVKCGIQNQQNGCLHITKDVRTWKNKALFIRPDLSSLTEYRNNVSVREIPSELKKLEPLRNQ